MSLPWRFSASARASTSKAVSVPSRSRPARAAAWHFPQLPGLNARLDDLTAPRKHRSRGASDQTTHRGQHHRQRQLCDDEHVARAAPGFAAARAAGVEHAREIDAVRGDGRRDGKQQRRHHREQRDEQHFVAVDDDLLKDRIAIDRSNQAEPGFCRDDAADAAHRGEQHALGNQLPKHPPGARAQGDAQPELTPARHGPRQEHARDIRGRNHHHQSRCPTQQGHDEIQIGTAHRTVGLQDRQLPATVRGRLFGLEAARQCHELGMRVVDRDTGGERSCRNHKFRVANLTRNQRTRHPESNVRERAELDLRADDTDDGMRRRAEF